MQETLEIFTQVREMIDTGIEAADTMLSYLQVENMEMFEQLSSDLLYLCITLEEASENLKKMNNRINLPVAMKSVHASLSRICEYAKSNPRKAEQKMEFELIPLMQEMAHNFYFFGCLNPEPDERKKIIENADEYPYLGNKYIEEAERTGSYKYDISIVVLAYNNLEYTKKCIEGIKRNLPKNLRCELILVNHGSTDGTKDYFESCNPDKQIDVLLNGGGHECSRWVLEGKYMCGVSNDVVVGENAIQNMFDCLESDENIGWVVPTTPGVSNFQTLKAISYESEEDFFRLSRQNNVRNPYRWEQRPRLCNPIDMKRSSLYTKEMALFLASEDPFSFPDDKLSAYIRKKGMRMFLLKDSLCHHFGSVTVSTQIEKKEDDYYLNGRKEFRSLFGYDPWLNGTTYDPMLFQALPCNKKGKVKIAGICSGLGANPLKIKEIMKEETHNLDVEITNFTVGHLLESELQSLSTEVICVSQPGDFLTALPGKKYDYILYEADINMHNFLLERYLKLLNEDGFFVARATLDKKIGVVAKNPMFFKAIESSEGGTLWMIFKKK